MKLLGCCRAEHGRAYNQNHSVVHITASVKHACDVLVGRVKDVAPIRPSKQQDQRVWTRLHAPRRALISTLSRLVNLSRHHSPLFCCECARDTFMGNNSQAAASLGYARSDAATMQELRQGRMF